MKILLIVNIRKSFFIYSTFSLELWQGKSSYNDFVSQRQNKYFTFSSSSLTYESKKWPREIGIRYPILLNFYASGYPRYLITKIFILPVYAADQLIPWLTISGMSSARLNLAILKVEARSKKFVFLSPLQMIL